MTNLNEFDLDPVVNQDDNGDDGISPKSQFSFATTKPCIVTDIITVLSQVSTSLSNNPGYTESNC